MKPTEIKIGDLLYQRQPFVIPKYQRAYAWTSDQIEELVEDLLPLWEQREHGDPRTHFFGSLVSILEAVANRAGGREYEVIDGQQRLATFTIIFGLIAHAYGTIEKSAKDDKLKNLCRVKKEKLWADYIEYDDIKDGEQVKLFRLLMSKADKDFYEAMLKDLNPTALRDSHKRLTAAKKKLQSDLIKVVIRRNDPTVGEQMERLERLENVVKEDCQVIHLVTDSKEEAYRLFQVLNDRGIQLTEGDLLRSVSLEQLEKFPQLQQPAEAAWDDVLEGSASTTEHFLRTYYASHQGHRPGRRTLFDDFNREFFKPTGGPDEKALSVRNRIESMKTEIGVFRDLQDAAVANWPYENGTASLWEKYRLRFVVKDLKHTLCFPLLLAAAQLPESMFAEILYLVERFSFRYINVRKAHPGKLENIYLTQAKAIRANPAAYTVASLREQLRSLQDAEASDAAFENALKDELIYSSPRSSKVLRYFMITVEQHRTWYAGGAAGTPAVEKSIIFDSDELEIEHIYPQKPPTPDADMELYKHRIGNLSFWAPKDNKAASNQAFDAKRPSYASSGVGLNRVLAEAPKWDLAAVKERETWLVELAKKIFTA
jgi:hypothetical protein